MGSTAQSNTLRTLLAPEGTRYAVLFTYAVGKDPSYEKDIETKAFNYGKAAAKIHKATQDFTSRHSRFPLDIEHLIDTTLKSIGSLLSHREEDWAYLQQLADKVRNRLVEVPSVSYVQPNEESLLKSENRTPFLGRNDGPVLKMAFRRSSAHFVD